METSDVRSPNSYPMHREYPEASQERAQGPDGAAVRVPPAISEKRVIRG